MSNEKSTQTNPKKTVTGREITSVGSAVNLAVASASTIAAAKASGQPRPSSSPPPAQDHLKSNLLNSLESKKQSKKELALASYESSKAELNILLKSTTPKDCMSGLTSGLGLVLSGMIIGTTMIVALPVYGTIAGSADNTDEKEKSIAEKSLGGVLGFTGGLVAGVVAWPTLIVGGLVGGVVQITRGIVALPESIIAPAKHKHWNIRLHKWVKEDLSTETVPANDDDILLAKPPVKPKLTKMKAVKELDFYNLLGVEVTTTHWELRKNYYVLGKNSLANVKPQSQDEIDRWLAVSQAFTVLSDDELRAVYDEKGRAGVEDLMDNVDPNLLFSVLFGNNQFESIIGRLSIVTAALVEENQISIQQAQELQSRRVSRLAKTLATRLDEFIADEDVTKWEAEAEVLARPSFGSDLLKVCGRAYALSATQFLGSLDNDTGLPAITLWMKGLQAKVQEQSAQSDAIVNTAHGLWRTKNEEFEVLPTVMMIFWSVTVVDITASIHESVEKVLYDQSVTSEKRIMRAQALLKLAKVFEDQGKLISGSDDDFEVDYDYASTLFQDAAIIAQVETVKLRDEAAFNACLNKDGVA